LAFGESAKSVVLFNLPNDDSLSITAKCLYVLTICGSFVLLIQPIFSIIERSWWYNNWFCPNEKPEEDINSKKDKSEKQKKEDEEKTNKNSEKEGGEAAKKEEEEYSEEEDELPWTCC